MEELFRVLTGHERGSPDHEVTFHGVRGNDLGVEVWKAEEFGLVTLNCRNDLRNHSPNGPEWGYSGSGPAQLALGLCAAVVADWAALMVYHDFKAQHISRLPKWGWTMPQNFLYREVHKLIAAVRQTSPDRYDMYRIRHVEEVIDE